ncbi:cache domain-containing sensor histidine kinase [Paenibacillus planticolens]|uniref:HAMP domain-containing protein n=1 Tax=Paenibacillus planticolens TaxID=2654976 RepID=A0ABX1ZQN0_9BACL|nr:histidine kinase [Paenibacillus planticolens]NOV01988.1 HAMP domain-containing protein [Paenibacillus planticolens]
MWKMLARMMPPRTLRFKLMIASVVCILIPACITISVYNYLTRDAVKEQAVSNAAESLKLVDGYVTNLLKYMLNITNYIQMDSEINTILREVSGTGYQGADIEYRRFADRYKITSKITNITFTGEKSYVTILLKNGTYYTNYPLYEYDPMQIFEEPWFGKLKDLSGIQSYWVGTAPTVFSTEKSLKNLHQISVARTLRGEGLDIYGYVIVTIMENQVNQIFNRIASDQGTLLLDESDTILSQRNSEHVGLKFPYVKQAAGHASDIIRIEDEDYLLTTLPLSVTDWKLVSLIPYKKAIFKIDSIFKKVFIYQVISFLVFLLLLLYLLQAFTKPLAHLGRVAATVRRGNLEVRSFIRGKDEIGILGMSIDHMLDHIKVMIAEITETQTRKRKAELAMLQVQINPHFLFNVLNSIRMKVLRKGDVESAQMMSSLSKLLRMTISQDQDLICFHEEVETVKQYVQLMDMRQKEKVNLEVDVSPDVLFEKVPRFFLQPIIENALIHGLNQCAGTITLRAIVNERQFVVIVEDNGQGMEPHVLAKLRHTVLLGKGLDTAEGEDAYRFSSVGLPNVWERMKLTFGDAFEMKIDSERGKGSWVTMLFPRELEGRSHV